MQLISCSQKSDFMVVIKNNKKNFDTLYIQEIITGRTIAKIPLDKPEGEYRVPISEVSLGELAVREAEKTYLTIIRPGVKKLITIDSISIKTNSSIADSLMNYLWQSTNEMFSTYGNVIFVQGNPDRVRSLFDSLIMARSNLINENRSNLTEDELGVLNYQNKARVYSFLMFYGRIIKGYLPNDSYFDFVDSIDNENIYSKTLPDNLLYKFEIQFLRKNESIPDLESFLKFIEARTQAADSQDFLKAIYLMRVIERPSYWRKHEKLFNTKSISEALEREGKNKYGYLIERASNSFFASQKGEKGFNFIADKIDGSKLTLADLKGKVVIIDAWATWCGPCIDQRPGMLEIAKKYKDNSNVAVLMISVDSSLDRWREYVRKTNENNYGIELNISDGMDSEFGDNYLIKAIPKYILIGREGIIINSNLIEPSIGMEQLIQSEIEKL